MNSKRQKGWSDLPSELLIKIAGNLTEFTDHVRFRAVCSHWRSCSPSVSLRLPQQLPWLALPSSYCTHFYSTSEDRIYQNPSPALSGNSYLFGSTSGWFLSISGTGNLPPARLSASLINPFTGASINLPSPVFLLSDELSDELVDESLVWDRSDSVVVVAYKTTLGVFYCRLAEATWDQIQSQKDSTALSVTFYEDRFYIHQYESHEIYLLDGDTLEQVGIVDTPYLYRPDMSFPDSDSDSSVGYNSDSLVYGRLLVSSNELFLLFVSNGYSEFYEIHRANLHDEYVQWDKVDDIGNRAFFVDYYQCFSVELGDHDLLRRNCVYTASWGYSISVFDVGKGNECAVCFQGALYEFRSPNLPGSLPDGTSLYPSWVLLSLN